MSEQQEIYGKIKVNIDDTTIVDFPPLADPIAKLMSSYHKFFESGLIPSDTMREILRAFTLKLMSAVSDGGSTSAIATDEAWGIGNDSAQEGDITDRMVAENWFRGKISDDEVKAYLEEMVNDGH